MFPRWEMWRLGNGTSAFLRSPKFSLKLKAGVELNLSGPDCGTPESAQCRVQTFAYLPPGVTTGNLLLPCQKGLPGKNALGDHAHMMSRKLPLATCTGVGKKVVPRLHEYCRQSQAEVVSKCSNKIHQTWGPHFSSAQFF